MSRIQSTSRSLLLEATGRGPVHQRVAHAVRTAIRAGRLAPGDALPASRNLATDLGVSRWVVTEAYQQLAAEGYLVGHPGSATRVASAARAGTAAAEPRDPRPARTSPPAEGVLDLRPGRPDLSVFPRAAWANAYASVVRTLEPRQLAYPDPVGVDALRVTVADYLRRVRGLDTDPTRVVITGGTTHGVRLLARALVARGVRRLAIEDPGWVRLPAVARAQGLTLDPVPVDQDGIRVDRLPPGVGAVLVTPAHQFPVGTALTAERRAALLGWAAATGAVVLEDDYDAEFRFDHRPLGALAGLDPERVGYLGSVSKTLAPALRLGWLVAPAGMAEDVLGLAADEPSRTALEQYALAAFIANGSYDRHLRRMRGHYRDRRDALVDALRRHRPDLRAAGVAAGLHLLVRLPAGTDTDLVVDRLAAAGVRTIPLHRYQIRAADPGLVVSFAHLPPQHADRVAGLLAATLTQNGGPAATATRSSPETAL